MAQRPSPTPPAEHKDEESSTSSSSSSEPPPPQPVSSDSEIEKNVSTTTACSSRLLTPYRSIGVVSSNTFDFVPHDNSSNSMMCVPIGNCFQLLNDKLQPLLVSQPLMSSPIYDCVTDATLSCTVVAHGHQITLFHRTQPVSHQRIGSIQQLLHLGRMTFQNENAMIVAAILSQQQQSQVNEEEDVPVVGDDSEEEDDDDDDGCLGQVVILLATRTKLTLQKRIRLTTLIPTTALHPATYLNKIVVGGYYKDDTAALVLLNIRTGKLIYEYTCIRGDNSRITTLAQSPAVDTIAVGTQGGQCHLINLRHDKLLFSLMHKNSNNQAVSIQSISFRTDASALQHNIAPMAVGRSDGTITIWDLTLDKETGGRTILCEIQAKGIVKLQFVPQEPLLLSTGSNSVWMHIFDNPDHSARLFKYRQGHASPPCCIQYLQSASGILAKDDGTDAKACQILSAGSADRSLRVFSTARTVLDKEYSQGRGLEKRAKQLGQDMTELLLPPVRAMAISETRTRDWGDLVTIHQDHSLAYVWSTQRGAQSGPVLRQSSWNVSAIQQPPPRTTHATAVAMSPCGNFCFVGTQGGTIYKYNVQSGNPRGSYPKDATGEQEKEKRSKVAGNVKRTMKALERQMKLSNRASNLDKSEMDAEQQAKLEERRQAKLEAACHSGYAVTGIAVDSVNKVVISVGMDAKLILWNFATHAPHKKSPYQLPCPATKMAHVRESDLAAVALDDFSVVLFDCTAQSIVRRFGTTTGHTGPISDLGFSPDGRSLFTSSLDSTLRVWDVPTNTCIDWLSFKSPPTSLAVSPTGEFLATTHSDRLGISIWSDRSYYQTVHVDGAPLIEPARMDDPMPMAETRGSSDIPKPKAPSIVKTRNVQDQKDEESTVPVVPKEPGLITLSGLPPAHWKNLFHLELVKERNKPKEPPKKPPSAPFFLQWRSGESVAGDAQAEKSLDEKRDNDEDEWAAAWSDDEDGKGDIVETSATPSNEPKRGRETISQTVSTKRRKVRHYRSSLATLLEQCSQKSVGDDSSARFQLVTDHIASLGPSAIDVELSTLCNGVHDLEEGLPLLQMASSWLLEASQSRERFEAVNAYIHRFLHLHSSVIAGIDDNFRVDETEDPTEDEIREQQAQREQRVKLLESISQLRQAQQEASEALRDKMQNTLCLLRHFSRMV